MAQTHRHTISSSVVLDAVPSTAPGATLAVTVTLEAVAGGRQGAAPITSAAQQELLDTALTAALTVLGMEHRRLAIAPFDADAPTALAEEA